MALRVERRDGGDERAVLIGMIVNHRVVGAIADKWERGLFASTWSSLVGGWCVDYYRKYHKAPYKNITGLYERWAAAGPNKDEDKLVRSFLETLSDQFEQHKKAINAEFVLDQATRLFNKVRINELREMLEGDIEGNDVDAALERIEGMRRVAVGQSAGVDFLGDDSANDAALAEELDENLITFPDRDTNRFFRNMLVRDSLISFLGREKVGKSRWLQDLAVRGLEQGRLVGYFEVGDNSQSQLFKRLNARLVNRPLEGRSWRVPVEIAEPPHKRKLPNIKYEWLEEPERRLTAERSREHRRGIVERLGTNRLRADCQPNSTVSVNYIRAQLDGWYRDYGWHPDLVVIDYADILDAIDRRVDRRDQINDTWKAMRALAQSYHCLVVTATQADAASYDAWVLGMDNFSEDKRKNGQVNGIIGINQTEAEKAAEIYRLNCVLHREVQYLPEKCLWLAGSMATGDLAMFGTFGSEW